MSKKEVSNLAKIIEFIHRRGYANGEESPSMLTVELAQLAWDSNWDVDDFMNHPDIVDYGFNKSEYLKYVTEEILGGGLEEDFMNQLNEKLFNFPNRSISLDESWQQSTKSMKIHDYNEPNLP